MAENNSNLIRPVNVLQGIRGSKPVKQRKGKKQQQHPDENKEERERQSEDSIEQQKQSREEYEKQNNPNSIDYCA